MAVRYLMGAYVVVVAGAALQSERVETVVFHAPFAAPEVVQTGPIPSGEYAALTYEIDFGARGFYAAFAAAPDGRYGWSTERHDMADARAEAIAWCNDGGQGCVVVGEIWPKGDRRVDGVVSLSHWAIAHGVTDEVPTDRDVWVALGSDGSWHVAPDTAIGKGDVRNRCMRSVADSVADYGLPISTCRVYLGRRAAE